MSLILGSSGDLKLLLGNEAIARGALEAGIRVATGYPGTPSTEIIEALAKIALKEGIYVEWSVNEKVALEVAIGASMLGLRSLVAMKHVGLNVASDAFMSLGYCGVRGGLVIISADDPNCYSSQNEQDNRLYGLMSYIPVYEPSDQQEAKDLTKYLFQISEEYRTAILLRITTRIAHTRGIVRLGDIVKIHRELYFEKDKKRWVLLPINARNLKRKIISRLKEISRFNENFKFNIKVQDGDEEIGIITSGISYLYSLEAIKTLGIEDKIALLKLSSVYPIPENMVKNFIRPLNKVIIIEEVEPFLELQIRQFIPKDIKLFGKNLLPRYGELNVDIIARTLSKFFNLSPHNKVPIEYMHKIERLKSIIPSRPPVLCPGCPHRATFYALKVALNSLKIKNAVFMGDIGCYTLGYFPPYEVIDTTLCMGSSIGLANGIAHFSKDIVIAIIGDSTFFHTGIPPLINAIYNKAPMLIVILDNMVTAMTGHQPHPGTGITAMSIKTKTIHIEKLVRSLGVSLVEVIDPYDIKKSIEKFMDAIKHIKVMNEIAIVISRRPCVLVELRRKNKRRLRNVIYEVDYGKCKRCFICYTKLACPAIRIENKNVIIDKSLCTSCGVCYQVCPFGAIKEKEVNING